MRAGGDVVQHFVSAQAFCSARRLGTFPQVFVLVMAKEPVAGRVKTRLSPPCTAQQAADIAEAALADTLDAAVASGADSVVVALDGEPGPWLPAGVHVVPQVDAGFDRRLTQAWADADRLVGGGGVQIGMDTPQVTPALLDSAMDALRAPDVDAVLGLAEDGGWWAIGLHAADDRVFGGIPMSTDHTGTAQRARLDSLDLVVSDLPVLLDVDHFTEAVAVAADIPGSRFAEAVRRVGAQTAGGHP